MIDYNDAYIPVKRTITVTDTTNQDQANNGAIKKAIFKNYAPVVRCISWINNTQVDDAQCTDVVMSMYNLTEYSDNYSKTSEILGQYCRDEPALANNCDITDFNEGNADNNSFKTK